MNTLTIKNVSKLPSTVRRVKLAVALSLYVRFGKKPAPRLLVKPMYYVVLGFSWTLRPLKALSRLADLDVGFWLVPLKLLFAVEIFLMEMAVAGMKAEVEEISSKKQSNP